MCEGVEDGRKSGRVFEKRLELRDMGGGGMGRRAKMREGGRTKKEREKYRKEFHPTKVVLLQSIFPRLYLSHLLTPHSYLPEFTEYFLGVT